MLVQVCPFVVCFVIIIRLRPGLTGHKIVFHQKPWWGRMELT
jgi:hypothetical protein